MSAPADHVPRLLECGNAMKLATCSPLAMRVYLHLFWGEDSEKPGFGRCSIGLLQEKLSSSPRAVRAALDELASAGLIVWSETERLAYRPGFAATLRPSQPAVLVNWHDTAAKLPDGLIASQVRKDIGPRPDLNSKCKKESNSGYSSIQSVSSVSSMDLPADAGLSAEPTQLELTTPQPTQTAPKPQDLLDLWNQRADKSMGKSRGSQSTMDKLKAALKRDPDLDLWSKRIDWLNQSRHHTGNNDRGWTADLLWMVNPTNADKIDAGISKSAVNKYKPRVVNGKIYAPEAEAYGDDYVF